MQDLRILITGGAGFIGSNLANALVDDNEVVVVDNEYLGDRDNLESNVTFSNADVLDDQLPTDVDVVYHLAALSSYPMHEQDPTGGVRVNVEGFVNVVDQALADGCERVVFASSSSLYDAHTSPVAEEEPLSVNSAYEASKAAREQYADYYRNHHDMEMVGLRLFSVYEGFGGSESHKGTYANIIAQFAEKVAAGNSPTIYGDGTQTRDFIHVDDVVNGLIHAGDRASAGIYNIGTGESHSFNQVVDGINQVLGTDVPPTYIENPIPEEVYVHSTCADTTKFTDETGWEPSIDFEQGLTLVCRHYPTETRLI